MNRNYSCRRPGTMQRLPRRWAPGTSFWIAGLRAFLPPSGFACPNEHLQWMAVGTKVAEGAHSGPADERQYQHGVRNERRPKNCQEHHFCYRLFADREKSAPAKAGAAIQELTRWALSHAMRGMSDRVMPISASSRSPS